MHPTIFGIISNQGRRGERAGIYNLNQISSGATLRIKIEQSGTVVDNETCSTASPCINPKFAIISSAPVYLTITRVSGNTPITYNLEVYSE